MNLKDKNIVLIAQDMYDYPKEIIATLEMYGAHVSYYKDCPNSLADRIQRNINHAFKEKVNAQFLNNLLKSLAQKKIDIVFIIKGTSLTSQFLEQLRLQHPNTKIIMYQWDINEKYPYLHLVDKVDACYVFDKSEMAIHPKLKYLPLFYRDSYTSLRNSETKTDFDLLHIGTFHKGKAAQIKEIYDTLNLKNVTVYWYLVVDFLEWVLRVLKGELYFKVHFSSLNNAQIVKLYSKSKAIMDLPQAKQKGITMRTFEVLGAYKKLVTTNPTILNEKIYFKELIYVIGNDTRLISDFLKSEVEITNEMKAVIETYSIHNWLATIFEGYDEK